MHEGYQPFDSCKKEKDKIIVLYSWPDAQAYRKERYFKLVLKQYMADIKEVIGKNKQTIVAWFRWEFFEIEHARRGIFLYHNNYK